MQTLYSGCFQFKRVPSTSQARVFIPSRATGMKTLACEVGVPFGLSDVSETFQRVMEEILFGLDGVEVSVDGVIVHALTIDVLVVRLRKVFERCRQRNLKLITQATVSSDSLNLKSWVM